MKDKMRTELYICQMSQIFTVRKWKKNSLKVKSVSSNKSPRSIRTRNVRITRPTLYPLGYGVSNMLPLLKSFK